MKLKMSCYETECSLNVKNRASYATISELRGHRISTVRTVRGCCHSNNLPHKTGTDWTAKIKINASNHKLKIKDPLR